MSRNGPALDNTDTKAFREKNVRRQLAYGIVNRRFQRLTRLEDPPFRSAGLGTSEVFDVGADHQPGGLCGRRRMEAARSPRRRPNTAARSNSASPRPKSPSKSPTCAPALENNAAGSATRSNGNFITGAITLLQDGQVPTTPESSLERFLEHLPADHAGERARGAQGGAGPARQTR